MILTIGYGKIGAIIANELSREFEVTVIDKRKITVQNSKIKTVLTGEVFEFPEIIKAADVIVSTLPGSVSFKIISKLLTYGKKIIDVSYMPENPLILHSFATKNHALLVPDAGYAPGLTNILAAYLYRKYHPKILEIYTGGLPKTKIAPLDYVVTWSVSGLIDEYTRPARIVKNNNIISVDPLETIESKHVSEVGQLETFYSDGLRTLLYTLKNVDMVEKTYRYPGHLQKIRLLRDLGYFSEKSYNGCTPRAVTEQLFEHTLNYPVEDLSILEVRAIGAYNKEIHYVDYYDKHKNITSMARMTGFPAAILAKFIHDGKIKQYGVFPPEYIGFDDVLFAEMLKELNTVGISIKLE